MDLITKILLGVSLVIFGGIAIVTSGSADCSQANHVDKCKQALDIMTYVGWASTLGGLLLTALVAKFTPGDKPISEQQTNGDVK